uniref:Uncharacterized protein n=1 Tax=Beta vulgaris TaxID=161934 RepID=E2DN02_BETVU|nr:hypothetical protein [Beta vulgaris]
MSQKQRKWKVMIHAFGLFRGPSFGCHWMPPRDVGGHWKGVMWLGTNMWMPLRSFRDKFGWEVIGKESCGLERICGCLYVHFEMGFTRNEQMGCLEAFRGNTNRVFRGFSRQYKWC